MKAVVLHCLWALRSHKWIGCYIQAFIIRSFFYQYQREDVLTAALTITILFIRCFYCAIFHPASLLISPLPSNSIFSVLKPLVLSILIKLRGHLKKRLHDLSHSLWTHTPVWWRTIQCFGLCYSDDVLCATNWVGKQKIHENALACFNTSA